MLGVSGLGTVRRIATTGAGVVVMAGAAIAVAVALTTGSHSQQVADVTHGQLHYLSPTNPPLTTTPE